MKTADVSRQRLFNHQIAASKFKKPHEIVKWMGVMQAQDFAMAKWAIGLRLPALYDSDIEKAFNEGSILRTHLLRPTWHFVTPTDIRWLLALTAPRVNALNAYWYRKFELDMGIFKRCNDSLAKTLSGGKQLTRAALKSTLDRAKIVADGLRLSYLFMRAELDGIVCSGAREGKQFTYALLDEIVPASSSSAPASFERDEALAELSRIYFTSRGPATIQDFAYWSGLSMKDARAGVTMLKAHLDEISLNGDIYHFIPVGSRLKKESQNKNSLQTSFLLPDYDEYGISYKNRSAILNSKDSFEILGDNGRYNHMIVVDGIITGTWQRTIKNNTIFIETTCAKSLTKAKHIEVTKAVKRYCTFAGKVFE
jgi:Winged helix DNA-binding domain